MSKPNIILPVAMVAGLALFGLVACTAKQEQQACADAAKAQAFVPLGEAAVGLADPKLAVPVAANVQVAQGAIAGACAVVPKQ